MFGWFKKEKSQASDPDIALVAITLLKGLEHAENLLRLGKDAEAIAQLKMMALPAARALEKQPNILGTLSRLLDLLIKAGQVDLAKEVLPSIQLAARETGADGARLAEFFEERVRALREHSPSDRHEGVPQTTVIYVCQKCGSLFKLWLSSC